MKENENSEQPDHITCGICAKVIPWGDTFQVVLIDATPNPVHPMCASGGDYQHVPARPDGW